jgi:hypothetical protein
MKRATRLFRAEQAHGNVVLNFMGSAHNEMAAMADAYLRSAVLLSEHFRGKSGYSDLDGCPIVFLYRHSLELFFKAICTYGNSLGNIMEEPELHTPDVFKGHYLEPRLKTIKAIFSAVGWEEDYPYMGLESPDFEAIVREFDRVDGGSFTFRYPVKKDGKTASVDKHFIFNIPKFCEQMEPILRNLSGACTGLEYYLDTMHEAYADAAADMYSDYASEMYDNYDPGFDSYDY